MGRKQKKSPSEVKTKVTRKRVKIRKKLLLWIGSVLILIIPVVLLALWLLENPSISILIPEEGAQWIRLSEPFEIRARLDDDEITVFRKQFTIDKIPRDAILHVKAFKVVLIALNGTIVQKPQTSFDSWKKRIRVDISHLLRQGENELVLQVLNSNAHPALLANCKQLGIVTGPDWEAATFEDLSHWSPAVPVNAPVIVDRVQHCLSVWAAFSAKLPIFIPLFCLVFAVVILRSKYSSLPGGMVFNASHLRWLLLLGWGILAVNNIFKLPNDMGFDVQGHVDYIRYVADKSTIPLANEGWQMFQTPLYYILSAILYKTCAGLFNESSTEQILRIVPLLCGLVNIEICFRFMRVVFPDRGDLQMIGTLVCGTMPMNIYMSQVVGNEPMAGTLSAIVLLLCVRRIMAQQQDKSIRSAAVMGLLLGLALLTKATAILLIPLVMISFLLTPAISFSSLKRLQKPIATTMGLIVLIAGWYYIRNWIRLGSPFIGGWDNLATSWWQDPSYRTIEHFIRFGDSLMHPLYSGAQGFWDALYSTMWMDGYLLSTVHPDPPWNYEFMIACAWLALPVAIALLVGMVRPSSDTSRQVLFFSRIAITLYLVALLYLFVKLPIYATVKATYTLGLLPLYGMFAAVGFSPLLVNLWFRASVYGWLACYGVAAYCSYFIL